MTYLASNKPVTLPELIRLKQSNEKIAMLTCYDASFANLLDRTGIDVILVGDSLGNVIQGRTSTLPVTIEHMIYHTKCVGPIVERAMVVSDMPFGSYQKSKEQAFKNAAKLMAAGAEMVKIEGGEVMSETVNFLVERGIPVCAHIGLTPQSVNALGGYRVQGRDDANAKRIQKDAISLEQAGAALMVLEMMPTSLAQTISKSLKICTTIGIGAGKDTDGQVLVLYDMLGVYPGKKGRFVKDYMNEATSIEQAIKNFVKEVKSGQYPTEEHSY